MANLNMHHPQCLLLWVNSCRVRLPSKLCTTPYVLPLLRASEERGRVNQKCELDALLARYVQAYPYSMPIWGIVLPFASYVLTRERQFILLQHVSPKPQLTSPQQIRRIKCDETKPACTSGPQLLCSDLLTLIKANDVPQLVGSAMDTSLLATNRQRVEPWYYRLPRQIPLPLPPDHQNPLLNFRLPCQ